MTMCNLCKIGWAFIGVGAGTALATRHKYLGVFLVAVGVGIGIYARGLQKGIFLPMQPVEDSPYTPNQVAPNI